MPPRSAGGCWRPTGSSRRHPPAVSGPARRWQVWAWVQLVLPWLARGAMLLSMTVPRAVVVPPPGAGGARPVRADQPRVVLPAVLPDPRAPAARSDPQCGRGRRREPANSSTRWRRSTPGRSSSPRTLRARAFALGPGETAGVEPARGTCWALPARRRQPRSAQEPAATGRGLRAAKPGGAARGHPLVVVGGGSAIFRSEPPNLAGRRWWTAGYVSDEELGELYQNCVRDGDGQLG